MSTTLRDPPIAQVVTAEAHEEHVAPRTHHPWRHFWRHFLEMSILMWIGMITAAFLFMVALNLVVEGSLGWEQALDDYPAHALLAVAAGMSVPMIPWMLGRGHSRRSAYEMAAVMALLVIPFLVLAVFEVVNGAQCGLYCLAGFVAMWALMLYRRENYGVDKPLARSLARFNRVVANPFMKLFAGWIPPFSIVIHRGRRSGRKYKTPAWAFRTPEGLAFAVLYGRESDWIKNVLADDYAEVKRGGTTHAYHRLQVIDAGSNMAMMPVAFRPIFRLLRPGAFITMKGVKQ